MTRDEIIIALKSQNEEIEQEYEECFQSFVNTMTDATSVHYPPETVLLCWRFYGCGWGDMRNSVADQI